MGIFSFIKDAGAKLFGGKTSAERAADAQAERLQALRRAIAKYGLSVEGLQLELDDDRVTVHGQAKTQEDKEKVVLVLGNVEGIATVDDRLTVQEPPKPEATFYEVKRGDSLSKIAKAMYGDMMKYPIIFEANKPMLTDPDKIYPGQVLRIPPLED